MAYTAKNKTNISIYIDGEEIDKAYRFDELAVSTQTFSYFFSDVYDDNKINLIEYKKKWEDGKDHKIEVKIDGVMNCINKGKIATYLNAYDPNVKDNAFLKATAICNLINNWQYNKEIK